MTTRAWQNFLRFPTTIGRDGKVTNSDGMTDGYAEDEQEYKVAFDADIDKTQDNASPQDIVNRNIGPPMRDNADTPEDRKRKYPSIKVTRASIQRYGFSDCCPGCSYLQGTMKYSMGHNDACRRRIIEAMMTDSEAGQSEQATSEIVRMSIHVENDERRKRRTSGESAARQKAKEELSKRKEQDEKQEAHV